MSNNDDRRHEGIGFRGLTNYHQPTEREIQAGIDAAMRDVVRHDTRNVHSPSSPAAPAADSGRVRGTMGSDNGWVTPKSLTVPSGVQIIDDLCNRLLPHGKSSGAK